MYVQVSPRVIAAFWVMERSVPVPALATGSIPVAVGRSYVTVFF